MFYLAAFAISFLGLCIATYTDLKERIISNKINYAMLAAGFVLQMAASVYFNDYWIIATAVIATALTFAISYGFWKMGVWAGGDVKLMTALAMLNPLNPNLLYNLGIQIPVFKNIGIPMFPLTLFIFSVFAMLPYGVLITISKLKKNREVQKELFIDFKAKVFGNIQLCLAIVGLYAVLNFFSLPLLLVIPLLFVFPFIKGAARSIAAILLFGFAFYRNGSGSVYYFAVLFAMFLVFYTIIKFYFQSKKLLEKEIPINELNEGDIPAETIILKDGAVLKKEPLEIKRIINYFKDNNLEGLKAYLSPKGTEVISARKARGVTDEEISELKKLVKQGLLENRIRIKMSAPFVPAVLIGYVMLNIVGDLIWNLIL